MFTYPVKVARDTNDTFLVTFVDFPEAHTFGDTKEEALERAKDALATIVDAYVKDRRPIPAPSRPKRGAALVAASALVAAKIRLYEAMREQRVGKAELARRLDVHLTQVDRLVDMTHDSRLEQIEAAFVALGKRLSIVIDEMQAPKRRRTA